MTLRVYNRIPPVSSRASCVSPSSATSNSFTKFEGNSPVLPFSVPLHQPSSTCAEIFGTLLIKQKEIFINSTHASFIKLYKQLQRSSNDHDFSLKKPRKDVETIGKKKSTKTVYCHFFNDPES